MRECGSVESSVGVWECESDRRVGAGEREGGPGPGGASKNEWWGQGLIFNVRHMKKKVIIMRRYSCTL